MKVVHERCAGLDVHKDTVVANVRIASGSEEQNYLETFPTTTKGLLALADWLRHHDCKHAAMEATGVYWKPVWHILEPSVELVLANAAHIKNMPGRKTDVKDATWIAELLAHGLIASSFVPPTPIQEMRDLTRTRKQLVRENSRHTQRIHKVLEDANLKIASMITDMLGLSGRKILQALIEGQSDPAYLAALADRRIKASRQQLIEGLTGKVTAHHRFLLKVHLDQIDSLQHAITETESRLGQVLQPFRVAVELLKTIPVVKDVAANVIVSEIGIDMSRFPTAGHLRSWARLCPRNDESAGKRRSTRVPKGSNWLKTTLIQCAWVAARMDNYLGAQFRRIKSRRGSKKAAMAVAASILTAAYHMLKDGTVYEDLGPNHFEGKNKEKTIKRLVRRLEHLGCKVTVGAA